MQFFNKDKDKETTEIKLGKSQVMDEIIKNRGKTMEERMLDTAEQLSEPQAEGFVKVYKGDLEAIQKMDSDELIAYRERIENLIESRAKEKRKAALKEARALCKKWSFTATEMKGALRERKKQQS